MHVYGSTFDWRLRDACSATLELSVNFYDSHSVMKMGRIGITDTSERFALSCSLSFFLGAVTIQLNLLAGINETIDSYQPSPDPRETTSIACRENQRTRAALGAFVFSIYFQHVSQTYTRCVHPPPPLTSFLISYISTNMLLGCDQRKSSPELVSVTKREQRPVMQ